MYREQGQKMGDAMASQADELRARLAKLRGDIKPLSDDEKVMAELRAEEAKLIREKQAAHKARRDIENAELLDEYRTKGALVRLLDLDPLGERPEVIEHNGKQYRLATRYIVRAASKATTDRMTAALDGIKKGDGAAKAAVMSAVARESLAFPCPATAEDVIGLEDVTWRHFPGDPMTIASEALTLAGVRSDEERKSG